jgi:phosphotriesterase-related protein
MVNTVGGPVAPEDLGVTLMHEHIAFGYPGWYGDHSIAAFDRKAAVDTAVKALGPLKEFGLKTVVDATPNECGRDPELLREVAEKTGLNIVCATGYYYEGEGAPAYFKFRSTIADAEAEIYEMFMRETTVGIGNTGIKAGVIKLASSHGVITDYEKMFFRAAARVQKETGVPIITHTQQGTMGPEQVEFLLAEGANPRHFVIGHMSDNTDIRIHLAVMASGAYSGFDRMGLQGLAGCPMDAQRYPVILGLIAAGMAKQITIAHDSVLTWMGRPLTVPEEMRPLVQDWHPGHLFMNIIPIMKKSGVTDAQINTILVDNPRRIFGGP